MPRFLNTWTGEFEWHPDPTRVTYAILSHVWRKPEEGGEQSYDDVRRIQMAVRKAPQQFSIVNLPCRKVYRVPRRGNDLRSS